VSLYGGNIEFARGAVDYFSSGENPLLHTWSLAVEEQFYIFWPLLFVFAGLIYERRSSEALVTQVVDSRRLLIMMLVAGAASFAASLWLTNMSQPWAFFGMPTRIWEFALGGSLVVAADERGNRLRSAATLLQLGSLAAIGAAAFIYDKGTAYPGAAALVPALETATLIFAGRLTPDGRVTRVLSGQWLRWLGRLSYGWYLWHWPLVGLGAVLDPRIGVLGRLGWSVLALGLAWLTYRFVEGSARDGRLSRIPPSRFAWLALGASGAIALFAHIAMKTSEARAAQPDQRAFAAARNDRVEHDCWATTVEESKSPCEFGDLRASTTVVLLGDSHAEHWLGALDRAGRERGWKIVAMVKGGCPVADMPEMTNARRRRYYENCAKYRDAMIRRIVAMKPAAVILGSWDHYMPVDGTESAWQVTPDAWRRGLHRTYARLSAAGIPTIAIRDVPQTWFDVPTCLSRRAARLPFAHACEYERSGAFSPRAIAAQTAAGRGTSVRFVDMTDQICPTAICQVIRNGVIVFTDDNHLTASFSRSLGPVFGARISAATGQLGRELP
jgi:hypothetical protein